MKTGRSCRTWTISTAGNWDSRQTPPSRSPVPTRCSHQVAAREMATDSAGVPTSIAESRGTRPSLRQMANRAHSSAFQDAAPQSSSSPTARTLTRARPPAASPTGCSSTPVPGEIASLDAVAYSPRMTYDLRSLSLLGSEAARWRSSSRYSKPIRRPNADRETQAGRRHHASPHARHCGTADLFPDPQFRRSGHSSACPGRPRRQPLQRPTVGTSAPSGISVSWRRAVHRRVRSGQILRVISPRTSSRSGRPVMRTIGRSEPSSPCVRMTSLLRPMRARRVGRLASRSDPGMAFRSP